MVTVALGDDTTKLSGFDEMVRAEAQWSTLPIRSRLGVVRRARHQLAAMCDHLVDAMPATLPRTRAEFLVTEVLPLLAACQFLEKEAEHILSQRQLGGRGLPFWLRPLDSLVERVPLGVVLIIAPSNYPLFLAGVQAIQALAAGNAVVWKPGPGGKAVADVFARALGEAGLPPALLRVTDESREAGIAEMRRRPDKVFFTGSQAAGREVLRLAAETLTPVIVELSGCDAVIVLPSAKAQQVVDALSFGIGLNGSFTCMAPRRLILVGENHQALVALLQERFAAMGETPLRDATARSLKSLLEEAEDEGGTIIGQMRMASMKPVLVLNGRPEMRVVRTDISAPVLTVLQAGDADEVIEVDEVCPFGLTAAIFGDEREARELGSRLKVGTVIVNDLIVPTADPRVSFGGRRSSGFGVTRGTEGLLEMTAPRTVAVRKGSQRCHYRQTTEPLEGFFQGVIGMSHAAGLRAKLRGLLKMSFAIRKLD